MSSQNLQQTQGVWVVRTIVESQRQLPGSPLQPGKSPTIPLPGRSHGLVASRDSRGRSETCADDQATHNVAIVNCFSASVTLGCTGVTLPSIALEALSGYPAIRSPSPWPIFSNCPATLRSKVPYESERARSRGFSQNVSTRSGSWKPRTIPFCARFTTANAAQRFQAQFAFLIRRFEQLRALDLGPRSQKTVVTDFVFRERQAIRLPQSQRSGTRNLQSLLQLFSRTAPHARSGDLSAGHVPKC